MDANLKAGKDIDLTPKYGDQLIPLLVNEDPEVRNGAAKWLAKGMVQFPDSAAQTLEDLILSFNKNQADVRTSTRVAAVSTLDLGMDALQPPALLLRTFEFFVSQGLADSSDEVVQGVLNVGLRLLASYSAANVAPLLALFEGVLSRGGAGGAAEVKQQPVVEQAALEAKELPKIGQKCLAMYSDGLLYPSTITKVFRDGLQVQVEYDGYGEFATLKLSEIKLDHPSLKKPAAKPAPAAAKPAAAAAPAKAGAAAAGAGAAPTKGHRVKEGVTVFLGGLAVHLKYDDVKFPQVLSSVLALLSVDSEIIQRAASVCLGNLVALIKEEAGPYHDQCLALLRDAQTPHERTGGALGLAGLFKGLGLAALKKYGTLEAITAWFADTKNVNAAMGAAIAWEQLFVTLGPRFEPNVTKVLPQLIQNLLHKNQKVQDTTLASCKNIFSKLSKMGVKIVVPLVIAALADKQWKSTIRMVGLLADLAIEAPQSTAPFLPDIIPKILDVKTHPRKEVQQAAENALKSITATIQNPEISKLVPVLLGALYDAANLKPCLASLMKTSFVHPVDAPSVALMLPILRKGLKQHDPATRKMSAQVAGSMTVLVKNKEDLMPFAAGLMEDIKTLLVDGDPDVRTNAAVSMGKLLSGMTEQVYPDLVPWLVSTLGSDSTTAQRSGAGQGLVQVLLQLGMDRTAAMMPDILKNTSHEEAKVREAYLGVLQFFPEAFKFDFNPFVAASFHAAVSSLGDNSLPVREIALLAGVAVVKQYGIAQYNILLPTLEKAIVDPDWRMRLESIHILGNLLQRIGGIEGQLYAGELGGNESKEDVGKVVSAAPSPESDAAILEALGAAHRNRLYAAIYLKCSDTNRDVGQMAWRVWKATLDAAIKTLTALLPELMDQIIVDMCHSKERQQTAQQALAESVQKMAETVLKDIVPLLKQRLNDPDPTKRSGVAHCLKTVMASATGNALLDHMIILIPAVRDGLSDQDENVRQVSSLAFKVMYANIGTKALDRILPSLLSSINDKEAPLPITQVFEALKLIWSFVVEDAEVNRMGSHFSKHTQAWSDGQLRELVGLLVDEENGFAPLLHQRLIVLTNIVRESSAARLGGALYDGVRSLALKHFASGDETTRACAMDTAALYLNAGLPHADTIALIKAYVPLLSDGKLGVRTTCVKHIKLFAKSSPQVASSPESLSLLVGELVTREKEDKNGAVKENTCQALLFLLRLDTSSTDVMVGFKKSAPQLAEALDLLYNRVLEKLKPEQ